jgi:hypothetical protein
LTSIGQLSNRHWRLNNLYYITDKTGRRVKFQMNWAQQALLDEMHYLNIILKARQLGFSTFIQLLMLDAALFNSNVRAAIIAHTLIDAQAIFKDKVKFPYENLPDALRAAIPLTSDSATELALANNSSIRVGTSLRSGTLNYLHVSEYGRLCAQYPEKAAEVKAGALNTLETGQIAFIESTAMGREGHFHELCEAAAAKQRMGTPLTPLDFKFHFFPWWKHPDYRLPIHGALVIPAEYARYFENLDTFHGIKLSPEQKYWYTKKADVQLGDMRREYPATPEEAFEASIEGAYYAEQLARAELDGRIGAHKPIPELAVNTAWDIGVGDSTAIWFWQQVPGKIGLVGYYENSGEGFPFYARVLQDYAMRLGWTYGEHLVPHDAKVKEWGSGRTRIEQLQEAVDGVRLVTRGTIPDGINAVRATMPICHFDEAECSEGIKALKAYRREWDEAHSCWKDRPRHDWSSHAADAFRYLCLTWREIEPETVVPTAAGGPFNYDQPIIGQITLDQLYDLESEYGLRKTAERF